MIKILFLLHLPLAILAQTGFYLSTNPAPYYNDCELELDSLPVLCDIGSEITINAFIWNPDSLSWCNTKEGFERSMDLTQQTFWDFGNGVEGTGGFSVNIAVLDTLEHKVTVKYLNYPSASILYKAKSNLPFLVCTRNERIFSNDSIHLRIESNSSTNYCDTTQGMTFFIDSIVTPIIIDFEDTLKDNITILTINHPSDTSIKLSSIISERNSLKLYSYNPSLNSYSFLLDLTERMILAKKTWSLWSDTLHDRIDVVFQKADDYDTVVVQLIKRWYTTNCRPIKMIKSDRSFGKNEFSLNRSLSLFDLKGRRINIFSVGKRNYNFPSLSNGTYFWKNDSKKIKQLMHYR